MILLALNDHGWKDAFPGLVTGKVSDFAGLAFFPLLLQGLVETVTRRADRRVLLACGIATGLVFAAVKTTTLGGLAYQWGLGLLQAPWNGSWRPVSLVQDATDLIALPAIGLGLVVGWRRHGAA